MNLRDKYSVELKEYKLWYEDIANFAHLIRVLEATGNIRKKSPREFALFLAKNKFTIYKSKDIYRDSEIDITLTILKQATDDKARYNVIRDALLKKYSNDDCNLYIPKNVSLFIDVADDFVLVSNNNSYMTFINEVFKFLDKKEIER